jgi:hypothetical protein
LFIEGNLTVLDHVVQLFSMKLKHLDKDPSNDVIVCVSNDGGNEKLFGKAKADARHMCQLQNLGMTR